MAFITDFHKQGNDTYILMNSPALKLILAFKITCILRSSVDRYGGQVLRRRSRQVSSFILIVYFWCLITMKEHTCIKTLLIMQWMMLLLVYYITLLWYCTWRPPPLNVSAVLGFGVWHSGRFLEPWDSFIWWLLGLHHVTHDFTHSLCSMGFNLHGVSMGDCSDKEHGLACGIKACTIEHGDLGV